MKEGLLFNRAKASIAFDAKAVNDINNWFSEIDERLFAFAYYSPLPLHETDARSCFYLAILNMYSLIWDCGPMLNSLLFDLRYRQKNISQEIISAVQSLKDLSYIVNIVQCVRSDVCHNNYPEYHFCKITHLKHIDFIEKHSVNHPLETFDKNGWEKLFTVFLDLCQEFYDKFRSAADSIKGMASHDRAKFISLWLEYIAGWYGRNLDISFNVLARLYPLSLAQTGKTPTKVKKEDIYTWIAQLSEEEGESPKDVCNKYLSDLLKKGLIQYIQSSKCAAPALPIPVLETFFSNEFRNSLKYV